MASEMAGSGVLTVSYTHLDVYKRQVLDNTGFSFYTFVRCEPGEYIIRLEMNPSSDYRAFVKELEMCIRDSTAAMSGVYCHPVRRVAHHRTKVLR